MPDWLVPLVVGFGGGLSVTLLQLRHDRGAELRSRMLEAADDFVAAYTAAREAASKAVSKIGASAAFPEEEVPEELRRQWRTEQAQAVDAAREARDALARREPRIALLFGRYTLAHRSADIAEMRIGSLMNDIIVLHGGLDDPREAEKFR